jgi:hypothetical protein
VDARVATKSKEDSHLDGIDLKGEKNKPDDVKEPKKSAKQKENQVDFPTPSSTQSEDACESSSSDGEKFQQVKMGDKLEEFLRKYHEIIAVCIGTGEHEYEKYEHRNFFDYIGQSRAYPVSFANMCKQYGFDYKIAQGFTQTCVLKWYGSSLDPHYFNEQSRSITQYVLNVFMNGEHFDQYFWKNF